MYSYRKVRQRRCRCQATPFLNCPPPATVLFDVLHFFALGRFHFTTQLNSTQLESRRDTVASQGCENIFHSAFCINTTFCHLVLSIASALSHLQTERKSSRFSYACHMRCIIFHCCNCSSCGIMHQFNRPRSVANTSSCQKRLWSRGMSWRSHIMRQVQLQLQLKFKQFDKRLHRMMIALIMSFLAGFIGLPVRQRLLLPVTSYQLPDTSCCP